MKQYKYNKVYSLMLLSCYRYSREDVFVVEIFVFLLRSLLCLFTDRIR